MNCGDVVLVLFPFTDLTSTKVRPAVVVSSDEWNKSEDRVLIPISSKPEADNPHTTFIPDDHPDFSNTGLRCASSAKFTKLFTASNKIVVRRLGVMPNNLLIEIRSKICEMFAPA